MIFFFVEVGVHIQLQHVHHFLSFHLKKTQNFFFFFFPTMVDMNPNISPFLFISPKLQLFPFQFTPTPTFMTCIVVTREHIH